MQIRKTISPRVLQAALERIEALEDALEELQQQDRDQQALIASIKGSTVMALARYVTVDTSSTINGVVGPHILFTGANIHVRSGYGSTAEVSGPNPATGLGNLIIGYNEAGPDDAGYREGDHNLVVGPGHRFSSVGGLVAGGSNNVSGPYSSVSGGINNKASGMYTSVSGGSNNVASGFYASVSGGSDNHANHYSASISGGHGNKVQAKRGSISGGRDNRVTSDSATVSGGQGNVAGNEITSGAAATVSGGLNRSATGDHDWVAGSLLEDN